MAERQFFYKDFWVSVLDRAEKFIFASNNSKISLAVGELEKLGDRESSKHTGYLTLKDGNIQHSGNSSVFRDLRFVLEQSREKYAWFQEGTKLRVSKNYDLIIENFKPTFHTNQQKKKMENENPLNQILFGPPGTGKTYHTINRAIEIINPTFYAENKENREALHKEFDRLLIKDWEKDGGQIAFCTFHQSMSYEDFVEGIKPYLPKEETDTEEAEKVGYRIEPGVFKLMAKRAKVRKPESFDFEKLWSDFYTEIAGKDALTFTSYDSEMTFEKDASNQNSIKVRFTTSYDPEEEKGKHLFTVTKNVVKRLYDGGITFKDETRQWTAVRDILGGGRATTSLAVYKAFWEFANSKGALKAESQEVKPYVLIIDEINRGNVSQIFGELITLIEEDKRAGKPEALEVILPYSKEPFSVPSNLYIIGTMNTADRSVEALDTALRRRFVFEEMPPNAELLTVENSIVRFWNNDPKGKFTKKEWDDFEWDDQTFITQSEPFYDLFGIDGKELERPFDINFDWASIKNEDGYYYYSIKELLKTQIKIEGGVNLKSLLETINSRIEVLLSKDHQIGHSYFMKVYSEEDLRTAFYKSIIPLLQEYFYGDYGKIGLVLGSGFVRKKNLGTKLLNFDSSYEYTDLEERPVYEIVDYRKKESEGNFLNAIKAIYS